ncbi:MAG: outer membrane beta-barrel protein [Bacteroidota bacterium]
MNTTANTRNHANLPMKHFIMLALGILMIAPLSAQKLKFGPRFAVSSSGIEPNDLVIQNSADLDQLALSLSETSPNYQIGLFGRLQILGLYIQPEFLLSTSSATFLYEDLTTGDEESLTERYFELEMPIMAGIKFGPFRLQAGPVYRMNLSNNSNLNNIDGLTRNFQSSTVGLQGGVGLDLGKKLVLDLKYEAPLGRLRDEVTIFGQTHEVTDRSGQLIGSIGYSF